eukprot:TRINITY_DN12634_c0_g1_i18.p1 TRINITY_DN12634_c0_g1~~TRINITY_DN12634_c0_g1_i18.p1  ORF type:complete len:112 (-),score=9.79 TRINITY_DN12634_c0_g1_i18:314-649(-)
MLLGSAGTSSAESSHQPNNGNPRQTERWNTPRALSPSLTCSEPWGTSCFSALRPKCIASCSSAPGLHCVATPIKSIVLRRPAPNVLCHFQKIAIQHEGCVMGLLNEIVEQP